METTTNETPNRELPQFLKVLCILTYIGSGVWTLWCLVGWWGMNFLEKTMQQNGGTLEGIPGMDDPDKLEQTMMMMPYYPMILSAGILGCLVCFIGALQMWKQKKLGFYIYAVGEIAPVIVSFIYMGSKAFTGGNIIGLVFPALFLVLYSLNFKHLS